MRPTPPLLALATLVSACSSDAVTGPAEPQLLAVARAYRMTGQAITRSPDGRTAECALDLVFELADRTSRNRDFVEYTGTHGGDVSRAITAEDGSGFALSAFVFGEVTLRRYRGGALEIHIPINETTDVPFYRLMARWEGEFARGRAAGGNWQCGPLDLNENSYVDQDLVAEGSWSLVPQR